MHILYDPASLAITCVFYTIPPETLAGLQGQGSVVEYTADPAPTWDQIYLTKPADGSIVVNVKEKMNIACAATSIVVGGDIHFSNVPMGAAVLMDGQQIAIMDNSGVLDITATVAGTHKFIFTAPDYLNEDFSVEVNSQS